MTKKILAEGIKYLIFLFGVFLLALTYNLFIVPNELVTGGTSGIAIILKKLIDLDPALFLFFINAFLLILSFTILGPKKTYHSLIGAFLYPLLVSLTAPLAIKMNITFSNDLMLILVAGILYGIGNGIVYRAGFTTGGSDILVQILGERKKISTGTSIIIINMAIILAGGFVFGFAKVLYALIIVYLNAIITDRILLGISDSKMFFVYTTEVNKIKEFIVKEIKTGITILDIEGGYSQKKDKMIMCVVRTRDYFLFKEKILEIDPKAFFVINDCYEVLGGVKRANLPFI